MVQTYLLTFANQSSFEYFQLRTPNSTDTVAYYAGWTRGAPRRNFLDHVVNGVPVDPTGHLTAVDITPVPMPTHVRVDKFFGHRQRRD